MNMSPTDILDVSGATYTYLVNGRPPSSNWTALFQPRERVRLRFINGSSMTIFDVRIPGLPMTVVQTDGNDVDPITVDEFRISVAETYDVIVEPQDESSYTVFAQSMDRTGYARGTLAPRRGMSAPIPPLDPRPRLTMVDMGMGSMAGMPGMNMTSPSAVPSASAMKTEGGEMNEMANMPGMAMGNTSPTKRATESPEKPSMPRAAESKAQHQKMPFSQPGPDTTGVSAEGTVQKPFTPESVTVSEGPQVDNVAEAPAERLAEPGNGLNGNGRRVLTYADLRARYRGADPRPADREIELHLTGNMERFIWGFNGEKFSDAEPIRLKLGERVRFVLINDTMMSHPIHLHGLWSELDNGNGELRPYKHTINAKPGERLSYLVSADTPGRWAYHCHLAYHMEAGMFREVIVS
jgi:CopA family copper-resistance protein